MDAIIKHAGISTLSVIGAGALTVAVAINPVGAVLFATGLALWMNEQRRN